VPASLSCFPALSAECRTDGQADLPNVRHGWKAVIRHRVRRTGTSRTEAYGSRAGAVGTLACNASLSVNDRLIRSAIYYSSMVFRRGIKRR